MSKCQSCNETIHPKSRCATCEEPLIAQTQVPFPDCGDRCSVLPLLGVCECESICPSKFDTDRHPIKKETER